MTLVAAAEMGRYGVTVNAIAPSARTRMTETVFADMMAKPDEGFDAMAPENISPLVVWLGSVESKDVTGKVFEVEGGIDPGRRRLGARAAGRQGRPVGSGGTRPGGERSARQGAAPGSGVRRVTRPKPPLNRRAAAMMDG